MLTGRAEVHPVKNLRLCFQVAAAEREVSLASRDKHHLKRMATGEDVTVEARAGKRGKVY